MRFVLLISFCLLSVALTAGATPAIAKNEVPMTIVHYGHETIEGTSIFYREAGDKAETTIVLLHGFPSSSHMFRDLIPLLAPYYHVIAPDYPGFGASDMPSPEVFEYSFDHLSVVTEKFLMKVIKPSSNSKFFVYMQDYGGPVGLRIAARHPDWIRGLIIQNANAYDDGLSEDLKKLLTPIWENRNAKTEAAVLKMFELPGTLAQYQTGARNKATMNPDAWIVDQALLDRPGNKLIQLELQATYETNLSHYREWHSYFKKYQPPTLVVWGKGDTIFTARGAEAYKKDLKDISIHYFDTGHFALEEDSGPIAEKIVDFIEKKKK